jgi:hypothetical protein
VPNFAEVVKSRSTPSVPAAHFGTKRLSSIIGWRYTSIAIEILSGPPLAGKAFGVYQSYDPPISAGAASGIAVALIIMLRGRPTAGFSVAD